MQSSAKPAVAGLGATSYNIMAPRFFDSFGIIFTFAHLRKEDGAP
jgi:hypothetical protein